jgi:hypothetical protein
MTSKERTVLERRIVFLVLAIAVALPLVFPLGLKTQVTPLTEKAYDLVESAPSGSVVLLSFDYVRHYGQYSIYSQSLNS